MLHAACCMLHAAVGYRFHQREDAANNNALTVLEKNRLIPYRTSLAPAGVESCDFIEDE
jgi:hypothetical protein